MRASRFGILLLAMTASAQAVEFNQVFPERSQITFVSKQMGVPVDGGFKRFQAQLVFDPAKPEAGKINLVLDLASIDAGAKEANDEVVGKNWFNVKTFPHATFVASGVRALGGGRYEARGSLSIKGRTREVTTPFSFRIDKGMGRFEGGFVMKRLEYGIGEGTWGDPSVVADEVKISYSIVAGSAPAAPTRKP
jgi:polyisoprenoid-binding protein YceI